MRCLSCNIVLSDFEVTRKSKKTQQYLDLCNKCFDHIKSQIELTERYDLLNTDDVDSDNEYEEL